MKPADPRWRRAAIAKGIRLATAYGDEARRPQHTGHQQTDGLRQKDGAEVSAKAGSGTALWAASVAAEQAGRTQGVSAGPDDGRRMECPGAIAGASGTGLPGRLHDFERLVAAATSRRDGDRGSPVRNTAWQTSAGGLGSSRLCGNRRGTMSRLG